MLLSQPTGKVSSLKLSVVLFPYLILSALSSLQLLRVRRGSVPLRTSTSSLMSRVWQVIGMCHGRTTPSCAARAAAATVSGRKPMTVTFAWSNKVNGHALYFPHN